MNKTNLILIWNINELYNSIWKMLIWTKRDSFEFNECIKKMELIEQMRWLIEEKTRGFLKTKLNYEKGWEYLIENIESDYNYLISWISKVIL